MIELYLGGSINIDNEKKFKDNSILFLLQTYYEMKQWKDSKIRRFCKCLKYLLCLIVELLHL